jgi:hypothetical protein
VAYQWGLPPDALTRYHTDRLPQQVRTAGQIAACLMPDAHLLTSL